MRHEIWGEEIYEEKPNGDWQRRITFGADRLLDLTQKSDSPIHALNEWWQGRSDSVPSNFSYLDVTDGDPFQYVFNNHAGKAFGTLEGIRFKDYPIPDHARLCSLEYMHCKDEQRPLAHYIEQSLMGIEREYVRLMCPVTVLGKVRAVAYAFEHFVPVRRPALPVPTLDSPRRRTKR